MVYILRIRINMKLYRQKSSKPPQTLPAVIVQTHYLAPAQPQGNDI